MGWKEKLIGAVSGMIAFATYVYPTDIASFFDSIVPNSGYYVVRIVFVIAAISFVIIGSHSLYNEWRQHRSGQKVKMHLGHLEGKLEGGELVVGQVDSKGVVGVDARKGSKIKTIHGLDVISEGMPATGIRNEGEIKDIEDVKVHQRKRGFWSRILGH
jgi:hypothetical protein